MTDADPTLLVHPSDASRLGLRDGERATIATKHGSCGARVQVTEVMAIGVVSLPHGASIDNVNELTTTADADPLNGMPLLSGFAVTVTPTH